jgi:hypothetical protein
MDFFISQYSATKVLQLPAPSNAVSLGICAYMHIISQKFNKDAAFLSDKISLFCPSLIIYLFLPFQYRTVATVPCIQLMNNFPLEVIQ